jgi:hypothetical protein
VGYGESRPDRTARNWLANRLERLIEAEAARHDGKK